MDVKEYLRRKNILINTPAIINKNGHFRLLDGELIEEKEFKKRFQLPVRLHIKEENPDKRKLFLNVK